MRECEFTRVKLRISTGACVTPVTEPAPPRPSKSDLAAAVGRTITDIIAHDLDVLFCGINPGLYSAATGHHFARPGNRFWPALHAAGFTPRILKPWEERELLKHGCGVTNLVARATVAAAELSREELRAGRLRLERKVPTLPSSIRRRRRDRGVSNGVRTPGRGTGPSGRRPVRRRDLGPAKYQRAQRESPACRFREGLQGPPAC